MVLIVNFSAKRMTYKYSQTFGLSKETGIKNLSWS